MQLLISTSTTSRVTTGQLCPDTVLDRCERSLYYHSRGTDAMKFTYLYWLFNVCSGSIVVTCAVYSGYYTGLQTRRSLVQLSSECQYSMRLDRLDRAYPSLLPFGVVLWVPEQLNILKAVTGVLCKLIDSCNLENCSVTPSEASFGICQGNIVNSTAWLHRDGLAMR